MLIEGCGDSTYKNLFKLWPSFGTPFSVKSWFYFKPNPDTGADKVLWDKAVENTAKQEYEKYTGRTASDDYNYDFEFTFAEGRRNSKYFSYLIFGENGEVYEQAIRYLSEKMEIVVKEKFTGNELERIDVLPLLSPTTKLPDDKAALFDIMIP